VNRYSQDRITRLVKCGHITLLAEWIAPYGRLDGHRLRHSPERGEANWWCERTIPAPHPSKFRLGKHDRVVAAVEPWEGRRTSIVAFRINDPEDWRRIIREDAREEARYWWRITP